MSAPTKNGTRQPHASIAAGESREINSATRPEARSAPVPPMILARLVVTPRRLGRADSKSMTNVPVNSPPSETPESTRASRKTTAAPEPIVAYEGRQASMIFAPAMSRAEKTRARLRPVRSPRWPNNTAPTGRATKAAAKIPSVARNEE